MVFQMIGFASFLLFGSLANVDDFDLYTSSVLDKVPASEGLALVERISLLDLQKTEPVLAHTNGCFLVVRTDEGNWSKLIVRPAIRKQAESEVPILVIQRYHTFRAGTGRGRLASGADVYLFDGFHFNLDIGQVVPEEGGGDIEFQLDGSSAGIIKGSNKAKMYVCSKPLVSALGGESAGPSAGPVVPMDFAGKYHLIADGKWSGQLMLDVTKSGEVTGSYVSDQTGSDYPVKGFVARPAHQIKFSVELPVAKQEFDGRLWTQGKNTIAGMMTLTGLQFGFVAVREGAELMPKKEK